MLYQGTLKENVDFLKEENVDGLFLQGSGHNYSDMTELNAFVLANQMFYSNQTEERLIDEFVVGYYGKAAFYIKAYLKNRRFLLPNRFSALSIYGSSIDNHKDFLSPKAMDLYSLLLEQAAVSVEGDSLLSNRVRRLSLGLDYVFLQQSKFYGANKHGILKM